MNYRTVDRGEYTFIEVLAGPERLSSEQDALDLVGACGEAGTDRLLIHKEALSDDFYNLRSGLAGAVLLKLSIYRIITAAVISPEIATQGRFGEMVLETNRRSSTFRVFSTPDEAEAWLAGKK